MALLPLPFPPGMTERVDPRMFPAPGLRKLENGRVRKDGRIGKRYGNQAVGFSLSSDTIPNALFQQGGQRCGVTNCLVRSKYGSTVGATGTVKLGDCSRFLPGKSTTLLMSEDGAAIPTAPTVAVSSGKVLTAWESGTSSTFAWHVRTTAGALVSTNVGASGSSPRLVSVGSTTVWLVFKDGTNVRALSFNTSPDAPTDSAATTIGALNASTDLVEASAFSSTQYLVVFQSGATQLTVQLMTGTTVSASQNITGVGGQVTGLSVHGTSGENIYVSWVEVATGALKVQVFNAALSASVGGPTTVHTSSSNSTHQPNMVRRSSTSVMLVWAGYDASASVRSGYTKWCTISNAAVAGAINTVYNVRPASKPFSGDSSTDVDIWLHTDNSASSATTKWNTQRTFMLASIVDDVVVYQMSGQPFIPTDAYRYLDHQVDVVSDGTTFYTAIPDVKRSEFGTATTECCSLVALTFNSYTASLRHAYREMAPAGVAMLLAGNVTDVHGPVCFETGFPHYPVVVSTALSAGGSVNDGAHQYRVVFEYLDNAGRRHRSAPSDFATASPNAGNNTVTLTINTLAFTHEARDRSSSQVAIVRIHVYRTKVNGSTYYRVTPNVGAPAATGGTATTTYVDTTSDANLSSEFLYTDGGVLANIPPPACRYIANVRNRIVLGGLFIANKVVVSKFLVEGEPPQFTDSDSFAIYVPEDVTAVAGLDDAIIAFCEDSIYVVYGDGPNDQGSGVFAEPRKLAARFGCIDHRSVVETPDGLMFQSKRGIELLPRGLGATIFIGADVQETLATYPIVQSATRCTERNASANANTLPESTVRFTVSDAETPTVSRVLTYDLKTRAWSVDNMAVTLGVAGTWDDLYTFTRADLSQSSPIRQESVSVWGNAGSFFSTTLHLSAITPFNLWGWGTIRNVVAAGQAVAAADLRIRYSIDAAAYVSEDYSTTVGAFFHKQLILSTQLMTQLELEISDQDNGAGATEGLVFHGLALDVEPEDGLVRLPDAERG